MRKHEQHIYQYFRERLCNKSHKLKHLVFFFLISKISMDLYFHDVIYKNSLEMVLRAIKFLATTNVATTTFPNFVYFL